MKMRKRSILDIFSGTIIIVVMVSLLSGCVQNVSPSDNTTAPSASLTPIVSPSISSPGIPVLEEEQRYPVSVTSENLKMTIHSIKKTYYLGGSSVSTGKVMMIINMTIENLADDDYLLDLNTIKITDGGPDKMYDKLSNPFIYGPIPPHTINKGEIVFVVKEDAENFTISLLDEEKNVTLFQEIGPIRFGSSSRKLGVTIHSAYKTREIFKTREKSVASKPGNVFVVVNMTIDNPSDSESYDFCEESITISGGMPITQKMYDKIVNPFRWGSIAPHGSKTGEVVFSVRGEKTQYFRLRLFDKDGKLIIDQDLGRLALKEYS